MKTIRTARQIDALIQRYAQLRARTLNALGARMRKGEADPKPDRHTRRALAKMQSVLRRFRPKAKPAKEAECSY